MRAIRQSARTHPRRRIERRAQDIPGLAALARAPERGTQLEHRARMLEPALRQLERSDRRSQRLEALDAADDKAERPERRALRLRDAKAAGVSEFVLHHRARL